MNRLATTTVRKNKSKNTFSSDLSRGDTEMDRYAIPEDSEFDDSNPTAFLPDHRKRLSLFRRKAEHVDIWS